MKIYLAARYSRREELCRYADELRAMGHEVTSRWLNGDHQASDEDMTANPDLAVRCAAEDIQDLANADAIISFSEEPRSGHSRGGRHVEFGMALALTYHRMMVVGPRENIFYCVPTVELYATWELAREALRGLVEV